MKLCLTPYVEFRSQRADVLSLVFETYQCLSNEHKCWFTKSEVCNSAIITFISPQVPHLRMVTMEIIQNYFLDFYTLFFLLPLSHYTYIHTHIELQSSP